MKKNQKLNNPVKIQLDRDEWQSHVESAMQLAREVFDKIGIDTAILQNIEFEDGKANVYIDTTPFENIPMLKGGRILAILQGISNKFPSTIEGESIEWVFKKAQSPEIEKSAANIFDTGLLNELFGRIGDTIMKSGVPEAAILLMIGKKLTEKINQIERKRLEEMREYLEKGTIYRPFTGFG